MYDYLQRRKAFEIIDKTRDIIQHIIRNITFKKQ